MVILLAVSYVPISYNCNVLSVCVCVCVLFSSYSYHFLPFSNSYVLGMDVARNDFNVCTYLFVVADVGGSGGGGGATADSV